MNAKTYCKKTAAFAGWLIQNVPADLDEETMDNWMNNPDGTKKFLSGLKPPEAVSAKPISLFSVVATTQLDGAIISTLAPSKRATFAGWATAVLGVSPDTSIERLAKLLKESGHIMTLAQVEQMQVVTDRGENTGMRTDGWGSFYFVENEDGSVSVGRVNRGERAWYAYVH